MHLILLLCLLVGSSKPVWDRWTREEDHYVREVVASLRKENSSLRAWGCRKRGAPAYSAFVLAEGAKRRGWLIELSSGGPHNVADLAFDGDVGRIEDAHGGAWSIRRVEALVKDLQSAPARSLKGAQLDSLFRLEPRWKLAECPRWAWDQVEQAKRFRALH